MKKRTTCRGRNCEVTAAQRKPQAFNTWSVAGSESWKGHIRQLRAPGKRKQTYVVITVSSLLCAARMEQYEKFLIPGIRNGCGTTVYNI